MMRRPWVSHTRMRGIFDSRPVRDALGMVLFLLFLALLVLGVARCKPAVIPAEDIPSYCYDEDLLRAKVFACVASAETKAESQACRKQSLKACGIEVYP